MELIPITSNQINELMHPELGSFGDMLKGQKLYIPVASDENGHLVFYGYLDYTGKSNALSEKDWKKFIKDKTDYEPIGKCVLQKSDNNEGMWIFATASSSIGACDYIAIYPDIWKLLADINNWANLTQDESNELFIVLESKDIYAAMDFCDRTFTHSFFTGLVFGPFDYIEGYKPDENGFAVEN